MTSNEMIQMYTVEKTVSIMLGIKIFRYSAFYAPNFEKVDGAYCFWSVRGCVRAWVGHTFCTYCNF